MGRGRLVQTGSDLILIGEYLQEKVNGRTVNGVPPGFADFTTNGFYVTGAYYLIPKKLQAVVQMGAI